MKCDLLSNSMKLGGTAKRRPAIGNRGTKEAEHHFIEWMNEWTPAYADNQPLCLHFKCVKPFWQMCTPSAPPMAGAKRSFGAAPAAPATCMLSRAKPKPKTLVGHLSLPKTLRKGWKALLLKCHLVAGPSSTSCYCSSSSTPFRRRGCIAK